MQSSIIKVESSPSREQAALKAQLTGLAKEIASLPSALGPVQSRGIADRFVSELLLSLIEKDRLRTRRQKQAAGIAAAKAREVISDRSLKSCRMILRNCVWLGGAGK